mmetsp:Transcript_104306/g.185437  ORF Transcript_104306/g.185437 Transcript_104306/m.185437 type:complete len:1642 (-) Transcript_104306:206-5131(-)
MPAMHGPACLACVLSWLALVGAQWGAEPTISVAPPAPPSPVIAGPEALSVPPAPVPAVPAAPQQNYGGDYSDYGDYNEKYSGYSDGGGNYGRFKRNRHPVAPYDHEWVAGHKGQFEYPKTAEAGWGAYQQSGSVGPAGHHICDGHDEEWGTCEDLPHCDECVPVDCLFSAWSKWWDGGGCVGLRFRHRSIEVANNKCGLPCYGSKIESEPLGAPKEECEERRQDCLFEAWSEWSDCAESAADPTGELGQSTRTRKVDRPAAHGGLACKGVTSETRPCGGPMSEPCVFSDWHMWTTCSTSCGEGRHTRMRRIEQEDRLNGETCDDAILETTSCMLQPCESRDCLLGLWSEWSSCGLQHGQQTRHRQVIQSPEGEGMQCNATLVETKGCDAPEPFDCKLSDWSRWTECDKTCQGGQQIRSRHMEAPPLHGGLCESQVLKEVQECGTAPCGIGNMDCVFDVWGSWGSCSAAEGVGVMKRLREVKSFATGMGAACGGSMEEVKPCQIENPKVINCIWDSWSRYSACSASCGGGAMRRTRAIAMAPQNGGKACNAQPKEEVAPCNTHSCDSTCQDGTFNPWASWTQCSATCGSGYRTRSRSVGSLPNDCGNQPPGLKEMFEVCSDNPPCVEDSDCVLSAWTQWSECSATCTGSRERSRQIAREAQGNGNSCEDTSLREVETCNPEPGHPEPEGCSDGPVEDCVLAAWSAWEDCSATCGGGQQMMRRTILKKGTAKGKACVGDLITTRGCGTQPCHVVNVTDCEWGQWSDWGACTKCGGQRTRQRSILQLPNALGKLCDMGSAEDVSDCNTDCEETKYCAWADWSGLDCNSQCGEQVSIRNRAMRILDKADDYLFAGDENVSCIGSQHTAAKCPFIKSCEDKCEPKHCEFGNWSAWSEPTCDGLCERKRVIAQMNNGCGHPCQGPLVETKRCESECAKTKDCLISAWSTWSQCKNLTMAGGQKYRERKVIQYPVYGAPCSADLLQTIQCNAVMPEPCRFTGWTDWGLCSVDCGEGFQKRKRQVLQPAEDGGRQCHGSLEEVQGCFPTEYNGKKCPKRQDCEMSSWADWGECGFSMQRERKRDFTKMTYLGGLPCLGPLIETETCHRMPVDCEMSSWTDWGTCSKTCGAGQTRRQRQIQIFPKHGGSLCPEDMVQTKGCSEKQCRFEDCQVSGWMDWGDCSVSCGSGHQERHRTVVSLRQPGGSGCWFHLAENRACANYDCDKDCKWSTWTSWSGCTKSCGGGIMKRTRQIDTMPTEGGTPCRERDMHEVLPCNLGECSEICVDGLWGDWEDWAPCTRTCAGGEKYRRRQVKRMANSCGLPAIGDDKEVAFCSLDIPCHGSKDCLFTAWSDWNSCSASCTGVTMRKREIASYGHGQGLFCLGGLKEIAPCNPGEDEDPPPGCITGPAVDCVLSEWESWKACSATCGGGERLRSRKVLQEPYHGGLGCESHLSEIEECARGSCGGPEPLDCVFGEWKDWGECGRCNGERKRLREILIYPANGGLECAPADLEEVGECPHGCDVENFCEWAGWAQWARCTATCGTGGKRKRIRALKMFARSVKAIHEARETYSTGFAGSDLMQKYNDLYSRTKDLEVNHFQDIVLAFSAGSVSLLIIGLIVMRFAGRRTIHEQSEVLTPTAGSAGSSLLE